MKPKTPEKMALNVGDAFEAPNRYRVELVHHFPGQTEGGMDGFIAPVFKFTRTSVSEALQSDSVVSRIPDPKVIDTPKDVVYKP